jgi:hypothetical protein
LGDEYNVALDYGVCKLEVLPFKWESWWVKLSPMWCSSQGNIYNQMECNKIGLVFVAIYHKILFFIYVNVLLVKVMQDFFGSTTQDESIFMYLTFGETNLNNF